MKKTLGLISLMLTMAMGITANATQIDFSYQVPASGEFEGCTVWLTAVEKSGECMITSNMYAYSKPEYRYKGVIKVPEVVYSHSGDAYTVRGIMSTAFHYCDELVSLELPSTINTTIPDGLFRDCTNLSTFYGYGASADNKCLVQSGRLLGVAQVTGNKFVVQPNVTSIGENCFSNIIHETHIILPPTVTSIATGAFSGLSYLKHITCLAPMSQLSYQASLFTGVNTTTCKVHVAKGQLSNYQNANQWGSFTIDEVPYDFFARNAYGQDIFYTILTTTTRTCAVSRIFVDTNDDDPNDFYGKYSGDIVIPSTANHVVSTRPSGTTTYTVTEIGDNAFRHCNLYTISLPSTLKKIGYYAFMFNYRLKELTIPAQCTEIGYNIIGYCNLLTDVYASEGSPIFTSHRGRNIITGAEGHYSALYTKDFKTLVLAPSGAHEMDLHPEVDTIGKGAFVDHVGLDAIAIPYGCKEIGHTAFAGCGRLTIVKLPSSIQYIGNRAFENSGLKRLYITTWMPPTLGGSMVFPDNDDMAIYAPDMEGYDAIQFAMDDGYEAFNSFNNENSQLTSDFFDQTGRGYTVRTQPWDSDDGIGEAALVYDPKGNSLNWSVDRWARNNIVGLSTQDDRYSHHLIEIGAGVVHDREQRPGQVKITTVDLENTDIQIIDRRAFMSCSGITTIKFPKNTYYTIGDSAFAYCTGLTKIDVSNNGYQIGNGAFLDCNNVKEIHLGKEVSTIGKLAFRIKGALNAYSKSSRPPHCADNDVFTNVDTKNSTLYVPIGSKTSYLRSLPWAFFYNIVEKNFDEEYETGDVNGDGVVDIADVNALINIILGNKSASDYPGNADVNGDGTIDIADVNAVINIVLG